ncbi:MAG: NADH-quinone oxidoreductase subunit NuoD [Chloroflexi bacterium CG_4_10_14_0_8_um_filter_46_9]|nr:MAG: NADH dehydrogenase [Dehalococcoidia bacterium CG2_30_46_19]PIW40713.1 MAG: NADH-quinone oxidoreductase subunit NuoD [Chloroflexi bacterium CG15_BIG_FIL_POST_REV_8_21_14_020_46_15]PIZ27259.1 MAG: NADH-quinone oxidoreductase subunit NuoD [Chloroflexi bacterium CG_4_10_14_0_8_um_filter_46_9]
MAIRTEPFVINVGPQHPSTHGVFRMRVTLDGEVIVDMEPVLGYLHRGIEKLAEGRTYTQNIPFTDRLDYLASMTNNLAYAMAVEKLAGIAVPERAEYLRVIMSELQRIASHLVGVGSFLNDCGAFMTPFLYMFREREKILDLFEMVCGQRLTYNYIRIGGVSYDIPEEFLPALDKFVREMPGFIDEYDQLLAENEILLARAKGVGILPKELAINTSASGPVLRASGVKWDIRKADPYSVYDRFEFDIPTGSTGDCYDRYRLRIQEMRQSVRIIKQAAEQLPQGEVLTRVPLRLRPPAGEAYGHIEGPKGELGFYLVSDNSVTPYRFHVRAPTLINLTALRDMMIGWKVADAVIIFGSIDICLGEVDR